MPIPFTKPDGLIGRFAVVKPWPDVQAAEDENIARLQITARSLGLECIVVDPEGVRLDQPDMRITNRDVDFVINLHFETPKAYDVFSLVALWNPLRFFKDWGHRRYSKNLLTHDDFLSCSSKWADHHVCRMIAEDPSRLPPHFTMYHSLSEPIFEPAIGHGKVFYAGINWDKLGKKKGRHQDLLLLLDKAGIMRIHGPRIFNNVNVWDGYKCYVGPVPFDGVSMIKAISEAGIALVFSSDAHKESELMSNRLFESLAAGAVIICDDNPFAKKFFGDTLLYVDASDSIESVAKQISAHHAWIHKNPEAALKMALDAQAIFKEKFMLDRSLVALYTQLTDRKKQLAALSAPKDPAQAVQALLLLPEYTQEALNNLLESVESQSYKALQPTLLLDTADYARYAKQIAVRLAQSTRSISLKAVPFYERRADGSLRRRLPLGRALASVIEPLPADALFTVLTPNERWFSNHIVNLVHALQAKPESTFAFSTSILRHVHKGRAVYELMEEVNVETNNQIPPGFGRFLLRRSAVTAEHFEMMYFLDMRCLSPMLVRGKGACSPRATDLMRLNEPFVTGEVLEDLIEQLIVEDRYTEIEPPLNLRHIQATLVHPGLVTSLQNLVQTSYQTILMRLQASEGPDAAAPRTLRHLRQQLIYELFHQEATLAKCESAAAKLPRNVIAEAMAEVMNAEKCDTLLAYWVGLHLEAAQKPGEALRAFNRALQNAPDAYPVIYTARAAVKAATMAMKLGQKDLAGKVLKEIVLKLQPSNQAAHAMLDRLAGKTPSATTPAPKAPAPKAAAPALAAPAAPAKTCPVAAPLVSAIVSTYNSEKFLRGCLEDLEAQTIADKLEIIVVDSNSQQSERAIVEEFQKKYPNITYIRTQQRETVYGAWNRGIKAARGKYVTNANTDDRHKVDALEIMANTLEANADTTLVYADCFITQTENETFATTKATRQFKWMDFTATDLLMKGCFCGPQPMWRRSVHEEHGYFDANMVSAGDYEFWLRIAKNKKFLHIKETLGLYLESPTSIEHSNQERAAREVWDARERHGGKIVLGFCQAPLNGKPVAAKVPTAAPKPQAKAAPLVLPPTALIGHPAQARELFRQRKFQAAWEATTAAIAKRPFHPEAYLLLAEIAQGAGDGIDAKVCAEHARRIAPAFKDAKKFLNQRLRGESRPGWLVLPDTTGKRLSVCMIVKNEEKFLGKCLESIRGIATQIIVVDTGSTDRTVEIAKEHSAEVYSFEWCDDFSAARNAALEHATGDWVLVLDADEELSADAQDKLKAAMANDAVMAWRLPIVDVGREADGCSYVPRLFRNAPALFYLGRVHEQVFSSIEVRREEWGLENQIGEATLIHHGYTTEVTRDRNKVERNLKLLERAIEELPGEPHLLMNYGLELSRSGREADALARYSEAWGILSGKPASEIVPELRETLLTQYSARLTGAKRFDEVIRVLNSPQAKPVLSASLHFSLGLAHLETKQFSEAADQMRQCLAKRAARGLAPINKDILTAAPHHCLALSLAKAGDAAGAEQAFREGLAETGHGEALRQDYAQFLVEGNQPVQALEHLNEIVASNPGNLVAWQLGGKIALSRPEYLEFACDWTAEAVKQAGQDTLVAAQRAETLMLSNDTAGAVELWQQVWNTSAEPQALAALILCQMIESEVATAPSDEAQEMATSRAFIQWYQKLLAYRASETVMGVNAQISKLGSALPTASKILEAAMTEADEAAAAA